MAGSSLGTILIVVEALLYAAAAFLSVTGRMDLGLAGPQAWGVYGVVGVAFALALVAASRSPATVRNWRTVCGLSLLMVVAVHLTLGPEQRWFLASPAHRGYYLLLMLFGSFGSLPLLAASLGVVVACEVLHVFVHADDAVSMAALTPLLWAAGSVVACGVLPYVVARGIKRNAPPVRTPMPGSRTAALGDADEFKQTILAAESGELQHPGQKATGVEEILSSVVFFMSRNFEAYSALGFIFDPIRQCFTLNSFHSKSMSVARKVEIPLGKGIVGRVGVEKRSFMSGDLSMYGGEVLYYTGAEIINSILAVPIVSEERELLGALVVDSKNNRVFTDHHKETMRRFSSLAAALITNARMRFQQQQTAQQFQIFYETAQRFTTALKIEQIFDIVFDTMALLANYTRVMALTFDPRRQVGMVYRIRSTSASIPQAYEFPINAGLCSYVYQQKKSVNIGDITQITGDFHLLVPGEPRSPNLRSVLVTPILDDEARCLGIVSVESDNVNQFGGKIEQLLSTIVGNASVAIARALLYQRMEKLATTDGLTGLNNHRFFQETLTTELERSKRYGRPFGLLLMDIDHFKKFNDTYGHPVGDLVLKEMSGCIRRSIRQTDFPARYGGEEFIVVLPEIDEKGAIVTAERIRQTVEAHVVQSGDKALKVTMSVGVATFPGSAQEKPALINCADKALYQSKEAGRNKVTVWRAGM